MTLDSSVFDVATFDAKSDPPLRYGAKPGKAGRTTPTHAPHEEKTCPRFATTARASEASRDESADPRQSRLRADQFVFVAVRGSIRRTFDETYEAADSRFEINYA
jgi:hypothetical protein